MEFISSLKAAALAAFTMAGGVVSAYAQITIETVTVGNIGNAANGSYGAVAYEYQIGKYEVTNTQYAAFLNAVAATDTYSLYNTNMGSNGDGGITRSGSSGSYTYATKSGFETKPVNYVSFWDAARFANWLNNGQGSAGTETGSYTLGSVTNPVNSSVTRNAGANWVVTSENEWVKAAYYDPTKDGVGGYWLYPTKSASITTADANYANSIGTATNVGTYESDASFYGTFDQGGNVWEWNESISSTTRGLRGGSWSFNEYGLQSPLRGDGDASNENNTIGFRVASLAPIPEPSTYGAAMGVMALGVVMMRRRRARGTL